VPRFGCGRQAALKISFETLRVAGVLQVYQRMAKQYNESDSKNLIHPS